MEICGYFWIVRPYSAFNMKLLTYPKSIDNLIKAQTFVLNDANLETKIATRKSGKNRDAQWGHYRR